MYLFWRLGVGLGVLVMLAGCSSDPAGPFVGGDGGVEVGEDSGLGSDVGPGVDSGVDAGPKVDGGVEPDVEGPVDVEAGVRMRGGLVAAGDMMQGASFTLSGGLVGPVPPVVSKSASFVLEHGGAVSGN